jgi:hypothetical protein
MSSKKPKKTNSPIADWRIQWASSVAGFFKLNLEQTRRCVTFSKRVLQTAKQAASPWIGMQTLTAKLGEPMAKGAELDTLIRQKLGGLGYEF